MSFRQISSIFIVFSFATATLFVGTYDYYDNDPIVDAPFIDDDLDIQRGLASVDAEPLPTPFSGSQPMLDCSLYGEPVVYKMNQRESLNLDQLCFE